MRTIEKLADLVAYPNSWSEAFGAMFVMVPLVIAAVAIDRWTGSAVPAAMFGSVWGSLTTLGSIRKCERRVHQ